MREYTTTVSVKIPETAFLAPDASNRAAIESLFDKALERVIGHLTTAEERPPVPLDPPDGQSVSLNQAPLPEDELLDRLDAVMTASMNQANSGYIGHMDPMPTTFSVIGETAAAGLNNNMLSGEMSPALTVLELDLLQAMAKYFGLGEQSGGMLVNGGTLGNLQALAVARNAALDCKEQGLSGTSPGVIFASADAHVSVQKAAMILGLGTDAVCAVETDERARLDPQSLETAMARAKKEGKQPIAVIGTAGTTTTGSIDPLDQIADIAERQNAWFHVDAAYGGAMQFSERYRSRLKGIERADSVVFNPQKWLYITRTCVAVMFRDLETLNTQFRIGAPYMAPSTVPNLGEWSVQGTRSTDVLKLWLSLGHLGTQGCGALVEQGCALAAYMARKVLQRPFLRLACPPDTNLICFRVGSGDDGHCDAWHQALQQHLIKSGFFLSLPNYRGARWLRAVILNPYTSRDTIDRLLAVIDEFIAAN